MSIINDSVSQNSHVFHTSTALHEKTIVKKPCDWQLKALVIGAVALAVIALIVKAFAIFIPLGFFIATACAVGSLALGVCALIKALLECCGSKGNSSTSFHKFRNIQPLHSHRNQSGWGVSQGNDHSSSSSLLACLCGCVGGCLAALCSGGGGSSGVRTSGPQSNYGNPVNQAGLNNRAPQSGFGVNPQGNNQDRRKSGWGQN
ncbi:MAG: hypothetical protein V4494_02890 [Chlamydiota bacterium]